MRKRVLSIAAISILGLGLTGLASAPANAISGNACNQGTYNAYHAQGAPGQGLLKIGAVCHG